MIVFFAIRIINMVTMVNMVTMEFMKKLKRLEPNIDPYETPEFIRSSSL